ncbi:MAG: hypothetical protein H0V53_09450 [Rubrobacter sp.]|nr:hypothetical protein [Rubrobacter sp.]
MNGRVDHWLNSRVLKGLSVLYLGLTALALVVVHGDFYGPAVSFVPLYLTVSVLVTAAAAVLVLPEEKFGEGFTVALYALYAALLAVANFVTGGVSSDLYLLYFPLLFAGALHGTLKVGLAGLLAALAGYALAALPQLLGGTAGPGAPGEVLFRLGVLALAGGSAVAAVLGGYLEGTGTREGYEVDEDGARLLERISEKASSGRGGRVGLVFVDPGRGVGEIEPLLERVRARIGEPILTGEGSVFGIVLGGADERSAESAARRALATAGSFGAEGARAGAAVYPQDARSPEDLLGAAGRALEAAFEAGSASTVVLAGRSAGNGHRAV